MSDQVCEFVGEMLTAGNTPPAVGRGTPPRGATYVYDADLPPDELFGRFAAALSRAGDLYRHPDGGMGLRLVHGGDRPRLEQVSTAHDLQAVVIDRLRLRVVQDGKPKGGRIPAADLAAMLRTRTFLRHFPELDGLTSNPLYLPDWTLTMPGYNAGGAGNCWYYAGGEPDIHPEPETIRKFLAAMCFASGADATNAVAGALTVLLRNHWLGAKPWFPVTANRSHAGKGTVVSFMAGGCATEQVTYESTDWAFQKAVVAQLRARPDTGVVNVDNIRLDRDGAVVRSAFLERLLHEGVPTLYSPGAGQPFRLRSNFVVTATVNEGRFSEDLMNRAVPIRLQATGDLSKRGSSIGDPKGEFLPQNRERIAGEMRGMIEKWKAAGRPADESARHPSFPIWAREVGGILMVSGFRGFLMNAVARRSEDDPVRRALAVLGAATPDEWLRADEWAARMAALGLVGTLVPAADQASATGRTRGAGVVLSDHAGETFTYETEDEVLTVRLGKVRRRFGGGEPQTRYGFDVVERREVPADGGEGELAPVG
jgi:hypothetical protein